MRFFRALPRGAYSLVTMLRNYGDLKLGDPRLHAAMDVIGSRAEAERLLAEWEVPLIEDTYEFHAEYMRKFEKQKYNDGCHVFRFLHACVNLHS